MAVKAQECSKLHRKNTRMKIGPQRTQRADVGAAATAHDGGRRPAAAAQVWRARADDVGHGGANEWHETLPHLHAKLRAVSLSTDRRRRSGAAAVVRLGLCERRRCRARLGFGGKGRRNRGGAFIGPGEDRLGMRARRTGRRGTDVVSDPSPARLSTLGGR
jgi:hypothetical protein